MDSNMKPAIAGALVTGVTSLGLLFVQNNMVSKEAVERLSDYFDVVDSNMSYESALQAIYEESKTIKNENADLQNQILEQEKETDDFNSWISEQEEVINALNSQIAEQEKMIEDLNSQITALSSSQQTLADAKSYAESGDFELALRLLRSVNHRTEEMEVFLDEYTEKYIAQIGEQANGLKINGELDEALELVDTALHTFPENQALLSLRQDIEESYPLNMVDTVPAYEHDGNPYQEYSLKNGGTDSFTMGGVQYYNGMTFNADDFGFYDNCWAVYNLGGEYSRLEFTIGHVDGTGKGQTNVLLVFCDGIISEEIEVSPDMHPEEKGINVTCVQQLKLLLNPSGHDNPVYGLGNPVISKAN